MLKWIFFLEILLQKWRPCWDPASHFIILHAVSNGVELWWEYIDRTLQWNLTRYISAASEKRDIVHIPLQLVESLLILDCADGYHKSVPVLFGTGILSVLITETKQIWLDSYRKPNYTHLGALHFVACAAWKGVREVSRHLYVFVHVRSAKDTPITIPPNSRLFKQF